MGPPDKGGYVLFSDNETSTFPCVLCKQSISLSLALQWFSFLFPFFFLFLVIEKSQERAYSFMQSQCIYIHNIILLLNVIISNLPSNYKISILTNDFFFQ